MMNIPFVLPSVLLGKVESQYFAMLALSLSALLCQASPVPELMMVAPKALPSGSELCPPVGHLHPRLCTFLLLILPFSISD